MRVSRYLAVLVLVLVCVAALAQTAAGTNDKVFRPCVLSPRQIAAVGPLLDMFGLDRTPRKIRDMLVLLVGRVGPNISDISFLRAFFVRSAAERGVSFGTSLEGMVEALHSIVLATATCTLPGGAVVAG